MNRISFVAVNVMAIVSASAAPLHAQSLDGRPVQVGLMGGLTSPAGDLSTAATHAGNAGALVTIGTPMSHLRFRVDGQWQQISGKPFGGSLLCIGCTATTRQRNYGILDATANVVYGGTLSGPVKLYAIGGVGVYHLRGTSELHQDVVVSTVESETRFGFNGGVGTSVQLGHVATFFEVRFHQLFGRTSFNTSDGYYDGGLPGAFQFVPISLGIVF